MKDMYVETSNTKQSLPPMRVEPNLALVELIRSATAIVLSSCIEDSCLIAKAADEFLIGQFNAAGTFCKEAEQPQPDIVAMIQEHGQRMKEMREQKPIRSEQIEEAIEVVDATRRYWNHACASCTFLGRYKKDKEYDLYYCTKNGGQLVIRWGNNLDFDQCGLPIASMRKHIADQEVNPAFRKALHLYDFTTLTKHHQHKLDELKRQHADPRPHFFQEYAPLKE